MAHSGTLNMAEIDRLFINQIRENRLRRQRRLQNVKTREACIKTVESIKAEIEEAFNANW